MDAFGIFGHPDIEIILDSEDPTPINVSGSRNKEFYEELGLENSDIVLVRDQALKKNLDYLLEDHREFKAKDGEYSIFVGEY